MTITISSVIVGNHYIDGGVAHACLVVAGFETKKTKVGGRGG